ncbi:RecA-family ATPase [Bradyrhizobium sp. AZCC 1578]|uniref:AAA family ATPase n=1 Tax=Bradyrhizobium sp. AZCC 1578 TaxID=3117027 RepID=UPI002FEFFDAA
MTIEINETKGPSLLEGMRTRGAISFIDKQLEPLPVIDPRSWQGKQIPEREWLVEGLIPQRVVTLYSGDGGTGKTQTALQLIVAAALGLQWFGKDVTPGPCILYTAEDEADELHRRFAATVAHAGYELADLEGVRLIPMAGLDATLASSDKGQLNWTRQYWKLKTEVESFKPRLVVIDPAADVFGGDEINRNQVRQFIQKLAALALNCGCAIVLLSHPSLTGMNSGSGLSGSTAWSNSVRSRLYLQAVKDDPDARVLKVMKANYGRTGEEINLRWNEGVYVVDSGADPSVVNLSNRAADDVFLAVFLRMTNQGHRLSPKPCATYAPKRIAEHPDAKGYTKQKMAEAMQRLLDAGVLRIEKQGPPSRCYDVLVASPN